MMKMLRSDGGSAASYGTAAENGNEAGPDAHLTPEQLAKRTAAEKNLWWWNFACAIFHCVQAAIALGLGG